jgi:uncharacterized protein YggU (UPF0235/DUF167 family)
MACYRAVAGGVVIAVRLTPKAARETIDGIGRLSDGREVLIARVRTPPADGAANAALVMLLAKALKVPNQGSEWPPARVHASSRSRWREIQPLFRL